MSTLQGGGNSCRCTITTRKRWPLSEREEGLVLSHAMCTVEQYEAIGIPKTKEELVMNIMKFDEMESE
jgi:hypothetical protein